MQLSAPKVGQKSRFSYAANGLDSLSLASLACRLNTTLNSTTGTTANKQKTPLVVITSNAFEAQRLLDQRWLMARDIFKNNILAVNVTLVAGYDDTNWRDLNWKGPGDSAKTGQKGDDSWLYEDQSQPAAKKK